MNHDAYSESCSKQMILIEDSDDDAELLMVGLRRAGVANPVKHIHDGAAAIAYLGEAENLATRGPGELPAILLIDLKLPNKSGLEILEWLSQHPAFAHSLKIVVSGMEDMREIRKAYLLGAHSFLLKPAFASDIQGIINGFRGYWIQARQVANPSVKPSIGG